MRSRKFAAWMNSLGELQGVSSRSFVDQAHVEAMAAYVHSLASWRVFATHTFDRPHSLNSTVRLFEKFMRKNLPNISHFYAVERNPSGDGGHHVHALWDSVEAPRISTHREWYRMYGVNRIEPVRSFKDVEDYCAKYVCKEGAWWSFHLSPSRYSALSRDGIFSPLPSGKNLGSSSDSLFDRNSNSAAVGVTG